VFFMKILGTGGAGLVGAECCRYFAELSHDVISVAKAVEQHFPGWDLTMDLNEIFEEIYQRIVGTPKLASVAQAA